MLRMDDSKSFEIMAAQEKIPRVRKQIDGFTRQDVVDSFQRAFDMIGGTQRLALWANSHPDKFYPLYTKLLPATSFQFGEGDLRKIQHMLPPCALDQHPGTEDLTFIQEETKREANG